MVYKNGPNTIAQFLDSATADINSPTTSTFNRKAQTFREHANDLAESLSKDQSELQSVAKAATDLHQATSSLYAAQLAMVTALDALALVNTHDTSNNAHFSEHTQMHIGTALLKFSVLFKDLASLSNGAVRAMHNCLVFPLESLLKADVKEKTESKKSVDRAWKEYESRTTKAEKEIKQSSKDAGWSRSAVTAADLADLVVKERTQLQYELCTYFLSVHKMDDRKSTDLLQHLVDFYHMQKSLHSEASVSLDEYSSYIDQLNTEIDTQSRVRDAELRRLHDLHAILQASPFIVLKNSPGRKSQLNQSASSSTGLNESNASSSGAVTSPQLGLQTQNNVNGRNSAIRASLGSNKSGASGSSTVNQHNRSSSMIGQLKSSALIEDSNVISGVLWKKSESKLHRQWQRRQAQLKEDNIFYLTHSDSSKPPVEISMGTCEIKNTNDDPKSFDLYSFNRTYHFQADDAETGQKWINALNAAKHAVHRHLFRPQSETGTISDVANERRAAIALIRAMPGNDVCADCGSDNDVSWLSVNLGCLLCIECSGCHRDMGVHVSRIQSLNLDKISPAELLVPLTMNNTQLNSVYESNLPDEDVKLRSDASSTERRGYIQSKYVQKRYLTKCTSTDVLGTAVVNGSAAMILRYLASDLPLDKSVDMNKGDNALTYLIRHDASGQSLGLIELLLSNGFDPNTPTINDAHALHICVENNRVEQLKLLLRCRRIDTQVRNTRLLTAMELADEINEHGECAQLLHAANTSNPSADLRDKLDAVHLHLEYLVPDSFSPSPSRAGSIVTKFSSSERASSLVTKSSTGSAIKAHRQTPPVTSPTSSLSMDATDSKFKHLSGISQLPSTHRQSADNHSVTPIQHSRAASMVTSLTGTSTDGLTRRSSTVNNYEKFKPLGALNPNVTPNINGRPPSLSMKAPMIPPMIPTKQPPPLPPKRPDLASKPYKRSASESAGSPDYLGGLAGISQSVEPQMSLSQVIPAPGQLPHQPHTMDRLHKNHHSLQSPIQSANESATLPLARKSQPNNYQNSGPALATRSESDRRPPPIAPPPGQHLNSNRRSPLPVPRLASRLRPTTSLQEQTNIPNSISKDGHENSTSLESKPPVRKCRAIFDCQADNTDELSFHRDDVIIITNERVAGEDDSWMAGYVENDLFQRTGIFPVNFVSFMF